MKWNFGFEGEIPVLKVMIGLDRILCMTKLLFFHRLAFTVESSQMLYSGIIVSMRCVHATFMTISEMEKYFTYTVYFKNVRNLG